MSSLSPKSAVSGYEHAIAGFGAGATATLLTYPLDLLRTRFQGADSPPAFSCLSPHTNAGHTADDRPHAVKDLQYVNESLRYKSVWDAVRSIVQREGIRGTDPLLFCAFATLNSTGDHVHVVPGLYQGFSPNFIGSAIAWGQYFYLYVLSVMAAQCKSVN